MRWFVAWLRKLVIGHTVSSLTDEHGAILLRIATLKEDTAEAMETRAAAIAVLSGELSAISSLKDRL